MAYPVAVIQMHVENGAPDENLAHVCELASDAVARGAKLVIFPEACLSGIDREAAQFAERIPGPAVAALQACAGDAAIALPLLERAGPARAFSACAFVTRGGVLGVARRSHLFRDPSGQETFSEAEILEAASALTIVRLGEVNAGVLLGFDAAFPEAFRTLVLRGADLIVVALDEIDPDLDFLRSMAAHNRVPVLVANRLGFKRVYPAIPEYSAVARSLVQESRGTFLARCKGHSAIIGAEGKFLAKAWDDEKPPESEVPGVARIPATHFQDEAILTASFKLDELNIQRLTHPFLAARRPELYEH